MRRDSLIKIIATGTTGSERELPMIQEPHTTSPRASHTVDMYNTLPNHFIANNQPAEGVFLENQFIQEHVFGQAN